MKIKKEESSLKDWLKESSVKKVVALLSLVVLLYLLRHVLNLILLTFIFTYLFHAWYQFLGRHSRFAHKPRLFLIYGSFLSIIMIVGYKYTPIVFKEISDILTTISSFHLKDYQEMMPERVYVALMDLNIGSYVRESGNYLIENLANIGGFTIQIVIALILSFIFISDKERIISFVSKLEYSSVGSYYVIYREFGRNFISTFGKVVQVQLLIAGANALLSLVGLWILGFPQLIGLTIMIFFFGLIPVAGVLISLVPLAVIGFQIGGLVKVIHVMIMVGVIHGVENYFLNPKLYSMKMKLPIFVTLSVLLVSEHLFGVWGLLLGIPLFMFLLDMMKFPKEQVSEEKKRV